jgi:D-xylonolactonase
MEVEMGPELAADFLCEIGENPLWHPFERRLYWVDIPAGFLFRLNPETGVSEKCLEVGEALGGFTIQADGSLLLFLARGAVKQWKGGKLRTIVEEIPEARDSRFNDVIADPAGRVFCGMMPVDKRPGRLYLLHEDGSLSVALNEIDCPNGMAFTPNRRQLYVTDSFAHKIFLFNYDVANGKLSNRRVFYSTPDGTGAPDGMTVDEYGFVWTAMWNGGRVIRLRPDGEEERSVAVPARKAASVIFAGKGYKDLYITTAGGNDRASEGEGAGGLFRIRGVIPGVPEFLSRVML